jgi:hypothetical protein
MRYDDELDRALAKEQEILPSSGFVNAVMQAVQQETSAPPPIPFPWKRALPGIVAAVLAIAFVVAATVAALVSGGNVRPLMLPAEAASILHLAQNVGAGWIVMALLISFACVKITNGLSWSKWL